MREFHGKGAFITGAASGVGFALARAFGKANMRVMLADIEVGALNAALAELKGEGIEAYGTECDVADRTSVQRAAKETFAVLGKVHLVCSNAGVGCGGPLELITPGEGLGTRGQLNGLCPCHSIIPASSKRTRRGWPHRNDIIDSRICLHARYGSLQRREIRQCGSRRNSRS